MTYVLENRSTLAKSPDVLLEPSGKLLGINYAQNTTKGYGTLEIPMVSVRRRDVRNLFDLEDSVSSITKNLRRRIDASSISVLGWFTRIPRVRNTLERAKGVVYFPVVDAQIFTTPSTYSARLMPTVTTKS